MKVFCLSVILFFVLFGFLEYVEYVDKDKDLRVKDKIIYDQAKHLSVLKTKIREMKKAEPWLLLLHTNLPEIRQLELDCVTEALKQKSKREAKVK